MSQRMNNLRAWASPRKGSILVGISVPVLALIVLGAITNNWVAVAFGFLGIALTAALALLFIANPSLREPRNAWRVFVIFVGGGALLVALVFGIVALISG